MRDIFNSMLYTLVGMVSLYFAYSSIDMGKIAFFLAIAMILFMFSIYLILTK